MTIAVTFRCDGGELCPSAHLTDVELGTWYHEAVDYVVEHGIMAGVSATAFQPSGSLTRGQVVQILHNLEGKPEETAEAPFTDTAGHWPWRPLPGPPRTTWWPVTMTAPSGRRSWSPARSSPR